MKPPTLHQRNPFGKILPPTNKLEDSALERNIRRHGVLDSVKCLGDGTLLDGYRRWRISKKLRALKNLPKMVLEFNDDLDAELWVIESHMATRAFNSRQRRYLLGRVYMLKELQQVRRATDLVVPAAKRNGRATITRTKVLESLSRQYGQSPQSIRLASEFHSHLSGIVPSVRWAFLSGEMRATLDELRALSEEASGKQKEIWDRAQTVGRIGEVLGVAPGSAAHRYSVDRARQLLKQSRSALPPSVRKTADPFYQLTERKVASGT